MSHYEITRRIEWDMAHRVPLHQSKCRNLHGHRYVADITCRSRELTEEGFVIDFGKIKTLVGKWVDENWDHNTVYQKGDEIMEWASAAKDLGDWYELPCAPTAENLAKYLYEKVCEILHAAPCEVVQVTIWETPTSRAVYPVPHEPSGRFCNIREHTEGQMPNY